MRMLDMIAGTEDRLADLLNAEDAKTRRNAALLMGGSGETGIFAAGLSGI